MSVIEELNKEYIELRKEIDVLKKCSKNVSEVQFTNKDLLLKMQKSMEQVQRFISKFDKKRYIRLYDLLDVTDKYIRCATEMEVYKSLILEYTPSLNDKIKGVIKKVVQYQKEYEMLMEIYKDNYSVILDSVKVINMEFMECLNQYVEENRLNLEQIKNQIIKTANQEINISITYSDDLNFHTKLPMSLMIGKIKNESNIDALIDLGITNSFEPLNINLNKSGNVLISTAYKDLASEDIDNFIFAYIFKFIECFPMGAVKVRIFNQNANYLYKRLTNCFQDEKLGELAKDTVKMYDKVSDLEKIKNEICEDVFKKTSVDKPDLYSIYKEDSTDSFNLIVLRDGLTDANGICSLNSLEMINNLTKPGDLGHKCGLRFLIVNKNDANEYIQQNTKTIISQIQNNCEIQLQYREKYFKYFQDEINVFRIVDNLDEYIQRRATLLVGLLEKREKTTISIDDVAGNFGAQMDSIMYIPIGKCGNKPIEIPFSCKDENGTLAGQCIGYMVIGQSGSGKSSFFHSLVLNGCMKYSPKDLQFWLLDFKNGGASSKYSQSGLPHIRMIAENNKIDDALCLFQMVLEEMERRSKAFNKNFADNIVDYNKIAVEKGLEYFPRIIIAIDEVQEIFRDDNASVLQKLISSISTRMRSAGMHFVMVAQNLSDGKTYMLKDAFLPSATGRICFRVAADIPRDSGFDEEFVQRKQEITELKTGEAYVGYGKDTIKKVKMAYTSPQEMKDKYFVDIKNKYPEYANKRPLVIGAKQRLTVCSPLQGKSRTFMDEIRALKGGHGTYTAIVAEDAYRMTPLRVDFSQHENSSVLLLGSDKQIASSLCSSFVLSLAKQGVLIHLFNGDRTKVQEEYDTVAHSFMYVCQHADSVGAKVKNHRLSEFSDVFKDIYGEFLRRQALYQKAEDEDPEFEPLFVVINDLFAIEAFSINEMVEGEAASENGAEPFDITQIDLDAAFENFSSAKPTSNGPFRENVQTIMSKLLKEGWRQNIHLILAIKGDPYTWRNSRVVSDSSKIILFNTTEYADHLENTYYLKEMLKNISNDGEEETMAIWSNRKSFSKIRPIVYKLSDSDEASVLDSLILYEGE